MANIDRIVNVQIALNTTGISKLGFSTVMVIGKHTHGSSRVLTYTDTDQLVDDGFQTTDAIYKAVSACFSPFPLVKDIVGYLKMCHSILPIKR